MDRFWWEMYSCVIDIMEPFSCVLEFEEGSELWFEYKWLVQLILKGGQLFEHVHTFLLQFYSI